MPLLDRENGFVRIENLPGKWRGKKYIKVL